MEPSSAETIIIAAHDENGLIGSENGMPWNLPDEYKRYVDSVSGHAVVMGRRSWEIFGEDLSKTSNFVISRQSHVDEFSGVHSEICSSLQDALFKARQKHSRTFIAGGASIYELAIPVADEMWLSTIKGCFQGDSWFPKFSDDDWSVILEEDCGAYVYRRFRRNSA